MNVLHDTFDSNKVDMYVRVQLLKVAQQSAKGTFFKDWYFPRVYIDVHNISECQSLKKVPFSKIDIFWEFIYIDTISVDTKTLQEKYYSSTMH